MNTTRSARRVLFMMLAAAIVACSASSHQKAGERLGTATSALASFAQSNGALPTFVTVPFSGPQTAGDLNVVIVGWSNANPTQQGIVTGVSDTAGNAYSLAVGPTALVPTGVQSIYYAKNIAGSSANTVRVDFQQEAPWPDVRVLEYSGLDPTSPLDVAAGATGSGTTSSVSLTTTQANDLVVASNYVDNPSTGPGSGFTSRMITSASDIVEDEQVSAAGAHTADAALSSGSPDGWVMQAVAFKVAGTPVFVQGNSVSPQASTAASTASIAVRLPGAQTVGDLNLVVIGWTDPTVTVTSLSDTAGNTYVLASGPTPMTGCGSQATYYAKNIAGAGSNVVTGTFSGPVWPMMRVLEYGGLDATSPFDTATDASGTGDTATTGPITTSQPNDIVVVADRMCPDAVAPTTGFTLRDQTSGDLVEDMTVATAGSVTASVSLVSSGSWIQQMVGFKAASSGGVPPVDQTVTSTIAQTASFLYQGANPVQSGVAPGTIVATRAALLRGRVLDRVGNPVTGAKITVLGHSEFGTTVTVGDGTFSMAVNGGGATILSYAAVGYLPIQRTVTAVAWNDYAVVPDVVLTPQDAAGTSVDVSGGGTGQVARANTVSDSDGSRTATLFFPSGTQAELVTSAGSTTVNTLTVRATEYTVGPSGPQALPGTLPRNSGYTYAVSFTADEAVAAGASVHFTQPIVSYTDNFLRFTVGQHVPVGYYDPVRGQWVPSPDGLVIGIVGIVQGVANIDIDGDGLADSAATLAAVGITADEQAHLATLYPTPTSLWRVTIPHFSDWDFNWPFGPPPGAVPPGGSGGGGAGRVPPPGPPRKPDDNPCRSDDGSTPRASTIECQNGILHESIPIAGTPYSLAYSSDQVAGYTAGNRIIVPLTNATLPPNVVGVSLQVDVAGRSFTESFPPNPNLATTFDWDGNDAFGRPLQGVQTAAVSVGFVYQGTYLTPSEIPGLNYQSLFEHYSYFGVPATGNKTRQEITLWTRTQVPVGRPRLALPAGLGGWTLNVHHGYDVNAATLTLGDGQRRVGGALASSIATVAGTGVFGGGGDGGQAANAQLAPLRVAFGPDGSQYIPAPDGFTGPVGHTGRIRKIDPTGIISTVAGGGNSSPPGPATQIAVGELSGGIAVAPDGSFYFVANNTILKVDLSGIMTRVAGSFNAGSCPGTGDGGLATAATFCGSGRGLSLASAPDGSLYVADYGVVRKIDPSGIISTVVGHGLGNSGLAIAEGQIAAQSMFGEIDDIVIGPDGELYILDSGANCVVKVGTDGVVHLFAGVCGQVINGGALGGPAGSTVLLGPTQGALGPDGKFYMLDLSGGRITVVAQDGILNLATGTQRGAPGFAGDLGPAIGSAIGAEGIALGPDHSLYVADSFNSRVRRVSRLLPGFTNGSFEVAAADGSEVYAFDGFGRHLGTMALPTKATRDSFGYDSSGRVATIADADSNVTTIQRDASGNPTAIVSPFGVTTTLRLDSNGYLANVTGPAGAQYVMTYQNGLLTGIQFPTGSATVQSTKTYDALGRVQTSTDAAGHSVTFSRVTDTTSNITVNKATTLGVTTSYAVGLPSSGASTWTNTLPDGTTWQEQYRADGSRSFVAADGTTTNYTPGPDPRFGMQAPVALSQSIVLPSGLTETQSSSRSVTLSNPQDPLSVVSETDVTTVNGKSWTTAYSASARTFTTTTPVGRQTTTTVDTAGHPTQFSVPNIAVTSMLYDAQGRLKSTTQGTFLQGSQQVPRTWTLGYDALGYSNSTTDPLGITVSSTNDSAGRPTDTKLPDGHGGTRDLLTGYDGDDNVTSMQLPAGPLHQLIYTPVDALASYVPPSLGTGTWLTQDQYDLDGRLARETRPDGAQITYGYDGAGRLLTTTYPQGVLTRGYDPATGHLVSISAPSGVTLGFGYDGFLPKSTTWSGTVAGSLLLGYDSTFRMTSQVLNGGAPLSFSYDDDNLMTQAGGLTLTRAPQNGRLTGTTMGSLVDSYGYDANGQLASYVATFSGSILYSESIGARDGNGRITQRTETAASTTHVWGYAYDTAGRLTDVTEDGSALSHYDYDADDNRTTLTNASGTVHPTYDAQDRLATYASATYAYGANGELQSKTVGAQTTGYTYDVLGNLLHVALPSGTAIGYVIDGQNRRIGRQVNGTLNAGFLYQDALNVVAQLDASGNVTARFVFGSKPNVPDYFTTGAGTFRVLSDHLGSPRLVVNVSSGAVVEEIDYDEFGNVTNDSAPGTIPFGFAGGLYDRDTGLVRFGARDYDASVGRWTSKDPIRFKGSGLNLYSYALNNPINMLDSEGLQSCACGEKASAALYVGPEDAYLASVFADEAKRDEFQTGLGGTIGGPQDAFRHCDWSCLMTRYIGDYEAYIIGSLHEVCNPTDQLMDLYNNGVGRRLGLTSDLSCYSACLNAVKSGQVWRSSSTP